MNLVVQDGLKEVGVSVDRIRAAVRWVRQSPARLKRFKEFSVLEGVDCEKSLTLDVPTRWNSTYLMLTVASTKYITSNTYLDSISYINTVLKNFHTTEDEELKRMAESMTLKFNKYWGDVRKFNLMVFIASLFDPRTKLGYLNINLRGMYGNELGDQVYQLCEEALYNLFNEYKRIHLNNHPTKASSASSKPRIHLEH
ncbi:zinc finger BED domain-containing protein RICESLEEPER 2-like [Bidens hawaiensis]|uniref:zinc finger BED domain-containing protein RICESLEEPER 2-like n=1 Tax=Bidens hawaiensis TaxID=980011 RepID=UPI0040492CBF